MPQPESSSSSGSGDAPRRRSKSGSSGSKAGSSGGRSSSARNTRSASRARTPAASTPSRAATSAQERTQERAQAGLHALRERLTRGVVVTFESIQETLDEAVKRGRLTRSDAQDVANDMLARGRRQAEDLLRDVEALVGRRRAQAGRQAASAGKQDGESAGKQAGQGSERARRSGRGGSLPIQSYDELDVRRIRPRLRELTPAQLRKVRDYEQRNRGRKTVLDAIDRQLR